jgi:hypothetical protein
MSTLKCKTAYVTFLHYFSSAHGKQDFNRKTLPSVSEKEWVFIEDIICLILTPLKRITGYLSGEKYPTFAKALPMLRCLKTFWMSHLFFGSSSIRLSEFD